MTTRYQQEISRLHQGDRVIGGFIINAITGTLFLIMQPHLYLTSGIGVGQ